MGAGRGGQTCQWEAQLMGRWCCRAFCNNAGCASKQCWCFEWSIKQVSWSTRGCAVAEPDTKASYLVERCRVDPATMSECLLDARVRSSGTEEEQRMGEWCCREFCNNAGCVSAGGSSWFEWGVELVLRFSLMLRYC